MKARTLLVGAAATALLGFWTTVSAQETKNADQLRAEAAELSAKAQDLKAEGAAEEATKLANKAEKLRQAAVKGEKQAGTKRGVAGESRRDFKREVNELRERLKELEAAGKSDEAAEVKRKLSEIEDRLAPERKRQVLAQREERPEGARAEAQRPRRPERRPEADPQQDQRGELRGPRPDGYREGPPPRELSEDQRRLHHLMAAIENLRAAGMPEPAEHLERQAENMRQQLQHEGGPIPPAGPRPRREVGGPERPVPPARFGGEPDRFAPGRPEVGGPQGGPIRMAELQNEVRDLRQAVQELRRRLEEMSGARR